MHKHSKTHNKMVRQGVIKTAVNAFNC